MLERKPESVNTRQNLSWVGGLLLIFLGAAALLNEFVRLPLELGSLVWAAVFAGGAFVFYAIYLGNRTQWWAQIPAYVLLNIAVLIVAAALGISGDVVGIYVMLAVAFPFFYVYLMNRRNWWALIPAYTMTAIAGIILLSNLLPGDWVAVYVMFAVALPFYYVYLRNRQNWWALIPAGVMSLIGLGLLMATTQYIIPVVLILVGAFLLLRQMAPNRLGRSSGPAASGPEADRAEPVEKILK